MYSNQKKQKNPRPPMPENEYDNLIELLHIQANSENEKMIYFYLRNWLEIRGIYNYTDSIGNLIAVKGDAEIKPCIVSHMDTVHDIHKEFNIYEKYDKDGNLLLTARSGKHQVGVGGDDKCGIFACLYMLERFDNLKVVFFTQEETGLIGSGDIDHEELDDVGYIIQLDRWGSSDLICMYAGEYTVNTDFLINIEDALNEYGYVETEGLITDSINLFNNSIGVSCVNVSCGYYSHHSNIETIDVNELWNSILFTEEMINTLGCEEYPALPPKYKSTWKEDWYYTERKWDKVKETLDDDVPTHKPNTYDDWYDEQGMDTYNDKFLY